MPSTPQKLKQDLILPDGFNASNFYIKPVDIRKKNLNYKKNRKSHTSLSFIYNRDLQ